MLAGMNACERVVGSTLRGVRYNESLLCANAQTKLASHLVGEVNRLKLETPHGSRAVPPTESDAAAAQEWLKVPIHPPSRMPPADSPLTRVACALLRKKIPFASSCLMSRARGFGFRVLGFGFEIRVLSF